MPEVKIPCTVFMVEYQCDNCGKGNMSFQGPSPDHLLMHKCSACGVTYPLQAPYPIMQPIPVTEEENPVMNYKIRWDRVKTINDIKSILDPILDIVGFDYSEISPESADKVKELEKLALVE